MSIGYESHLITHNADSRLTRHDQHIRWPVREQADCDQTRNLVYPGLHLQRVGDLQIVNIENMIAVVGYEILAPDRLAPHFDYFSGNEGLRHWNDFDR